RPHTGVHRRTLRAILRARLGDAFHPGQPVTGYEETPGQVTVTLANGNTAQGDVLVGADGIRSAVRGQKLPGTTAIATGVRARDGDPARGAVDGRHAGHAPRRHAGRDRGLAPRRARPGRGRRSRLRLRDPVRLPRAGPAVGAVPGHAGGRRRPRHAAHARPGR